MEKKFENTLTIKKKQDLKHSPNSPHSMEKEPLLEFILKAHQHTYAAPKDIKRIHKCETPTLPGHKDYHYTDKDWAYHDSYAGKTWAPGREVVFFRNKPVWCMSYQGRHDPTIPDTTYQEIIFPFLQKALRQTTPEMPFRGPEHFEEEHLTYTFHMEGNYTYFTGKETITYKGITIFFQHIMGELIQ